MRISHKQVVHYFFFAVGIRNNLHRSFALKFFKIRKLFLFVLFSLPFLQSSPPTVFLIEHEMNIDLFPALVGVIQAVDTDKSTSGKV